MNANENLSAQIDQLRESLIQNPETAQAIQEMTSELDGVPAEALTRVISTFAKAFKNPKLYPEVRRNAITMGLLDEDTLPEQFDPQVMAILLSALDLARDHLMQQQASPRNSLQQQPQQFARGGLAHVARQGRNGDTMLAHINPREAQLLMDYGGSGSINPHSGLREFGFFKKIGRFLKKASKFIVPAALAFLGGPVLASALGGGILGGAASGAIIGGVSSAITGGNVLKGALMGGLGGGIGGAFNAGAGAGSGISGGMENSFSGVADTATKAAPGMGGSLGSGISGSLGEVGLATPSFGGSLGSGMEGAIDVGTLGSSVLEGGYTPPPISTPGFDSGVPAPPDWAKSAYKGLGMANKAYGLYKTLTPQEAPLQQMQQQRPARPARPASVYEPMNRSFGLGAGRYQTRF